MSISSFSGGRVSKPRCEMPAISWPGVPFEAPVAAVGDWQGRPALELEQTWFYPESGGQLPDRGSLGGAISTAPSSSRRVDESTEATAAAPSECATTAATFDTSPSTRSTLRIIVGSVVSLRNKLSWFRTESEQLTSVVAEEQYG